MKTYRVYYAMSAEDYVKCDFVSARSKRGAEKEARKKFGANIVIDDIHLEPEWSYTRELMMMNID